VNHTADDLPFVRPEAMIADFSLDDTETFVYDLGRAGGVKNPGAYTRAV
jgi:hypothetical protein